MTLTPDQALAELLEIRARLDTLEPASPEYDALDERRQQLAAAAQEAVDAARTPEDLQTELEHLEQRLTSFDGERIVVPGWQRAMATINDPATPVAQINKELDAKNQLDRDAVQQRIDRLRKALSR